MSNPMSLVELGEQHVALLPARTVLSLFTAEPADGPPTGPDSAGANGQPGHPGAPGDSVQGHGETISDSRFNQFGDRTTR
jgi:hypothetical protein